MTQVQASEVLKSICRSWKFTKPKTVKKILRLCRNIEKSEIKIKWKNNIVKNTLCGLQVYVETRIMFMIVLVKI